ncbi:protein GVQW3-like [Tachypleus tridentatus]|uniref:protein GVQW3-like n=1 Tax=Tachypleus tridentatus TaxID=6853 RepID=UPI003FD12EAE
MNDLKEQRLAVKFCVKLGKSATKTFAMLNTAYGVVAMKRTACFKWHERFKDGRQSIEDDERPGRPSTSTDDQHTDKINTLVRANRRLTVRELAKDCGISVGSCYEILTKKIEDAPRCCEICASELVSFWPNTRSLFFPTPPTHLTLLLEICSCSPNSKVP